MVPQGSCNAYQWQGLYRTNPWNSSFCDRWISIKNNVSGWVRNLKNGNVECILEGLPSNVEKVIEWCHMGPKNSRVDKIDINYETYTGEFQGFKTDG